MTVTVHELLAAQEKLAVAERAAELEWSVIREQTRQLRERENNYENFRWDVDVARKKLAELHQRIKEEEEED